MTITKLIADELVKKYETFYCKELTMGNPNNTKVFIYNYIFSDYEAFEAPFGREMRGLTIVRENGKEKIYYSIPKFFNINEIKETKEDVLKLHPVKLIQEKIDGVMVQPIEINGEIQMKTKQRFDSLESRLAQELIDNDSDLKFFILDLWDNNFFPIFELVHPKGKVLLDYQPGLYLTMVRNEVGAFVGIDKFTCPSKNFNKPNLYDITLEEAVSQAKEKEGTEGYVVRLQGNVPSIASIVKIKTLDYVHKHKLMTKSETYKGLLDMILEEEIDDILPLLREKRQEEVKVIIKSVQDYVIHYTKQIEDIVIDSKNGSREAFVKKHIHHTYFGVIMRGLHGRDIKKDLVETILKHHRKEAKAKNFITSIKN